MTTGANSRRTIVLFLAAGALAAGAFTSDARATGVAHNVPQGAEASTSGQFARPKRVVFRKGMEPRRVAAASFLSERVDAFLSERVDAFSFERAV